MKKIFLVLTILVCFEEICAQDGKMISKRIIELSDTPFWAQISAADTLKSEFQHLKKLNFYFITYESDGLKVNGILTEPKAEGKFPVVIFNRGGNRYFGNLNVGLMIMYTSKLAEHGYVIIGSNLRENDEFGGSEINDVLNLIDTLKDIEKADSDNIGMFGWSRGGMMTYLALAKSDKIKTAIVGNGPTNLFELIQDRPEMETEVTSECIPNYFINREIELKKRSVIFWPEKLNKKSSLLILAGTADERVSSKQAEKLSEKLSEIRYDFEFRQFETDHSFSNKKRELDETVINWFNDKLKNVR